MELLNNIWNALTTSNETLISIILIPSAIIEGILTLIIFTSVLNLKTNKKQSIILCYHKFFDYAYKYLFHSFAIEYFYQLYKFIYNYNFDF